MRRVLILIILACGAYLPALQLPFIEDDYDEIQRAQTFASTGWARLWDNPTLRTRATAVVLDAVITRVCGFRPLPFYAATIALHALCVLLVYAAAREILNSSTAFWTAAFFAIYEGHQEAVMWISAKNEELVFLFGLAAWLCWVMFLRTRTAFWYAFALASFLLAAFSKESFVIFPLLMILPCLRPPPGLSRRAIFTGLVPFFAIAIGYIAWIWFARFAQPAYSDDRFSLSAAFLPVMLRSLWRLLFVWGLAAIAVLLATTRRIPSNPAWTTAGVALTWMFIGTLPYSFLTYMSQIPSRATYIASAGLALLVGTAAAQLVVNRTALTILATLALAWNLEILWVKKIAQFRERAEPSELLKAAARHAQGPIAIRCTPFPDFLTEAVLTSAGSRAAFPQPATHNEHCFAVEYTDTTGRPIKINRQINTARHGAFY